jgi:site-specific DNA recombinase
MAAPAPQFPVMTSPQPAAAPAPVPVAVLARTSTLQMQDPLSSLRRQFRSCQEWLPPGFVIVSWYWDVESGGIDLENRSQTATWEPFVKAGLPRDGGMTDLLKEAAAPEPRFAAVVCEDIERSGRDTFNALKLERELSDNGVLLFATDEPAGIAGANPTTVLVRRIKQGVAEWFRLQIKEKSWKGLQEHSLAGWNVGPAPYGYLPDRIPHPVPYKAAQGKVKTRLALDPDRAPVVAAIFQWRTEDHLGTPAIAARLTADPASYPPPPAGWSATGVWAILRNPKYTGHMVYGRRRKVKGHDRYLPPDQWLWSPEPTHPAIVTREQWEAAQAQGQHHATTRDGTEPSTHPATRRAYRLRGRVGCRACQHRMSGITRTTSRYYNPGAPDLEYTYYACPPSHHRDPDHPTTLSIREDDLIEIIRLFLNDHVLGPERARWLEQQIPATAAEDANRRQASTTRLQQRLRQIDAAEDAHAREIEALSHATATPAAITALRTRLINRFTQLEDERAAIATQLTNLADDAGQDQHPELLDQLPVLTQRLGADTPLAYEQGLLDALGIQLLYRHHIGQVTIFATITDATPHAIAAISENPDGTTPLDQQAFSDLIQRPITRGSSVITGTG